MEYDIQVQTMTVGDAGYEGDIQLTIIGSARDAEMNLGEATGWILEPKMNLSNDRWFREDFGSGSKVSFQIKSRKDVGEMYAIKIKLTNQSNAWKPGMVTVTKQDGNATTGYFPCYQWITTEATVREAKATLAFQDNEKLTALRRAEVEKWKKLLPWRDWQSMPSHPDYPDQASLPRDLQFDDSKQSDMKEYKNEGIANLLLQGIKNVFDKIDSYFDYTKFFSLGVGHGKVPSVSERWYTDREFGRQFLQGVHPDAIRGVEKLPAKFPVTDEQVKGTLGRGVTLEQAINAGHIYMVDYEILAGLPVREDRYMTPAMGLFYVTASHEFLPIAIQLYQEPGPGNPIWTPKDAHNDWLYAKMFLRCADAQIHEVVGHFLLTHVIVEATMTSMLRNVPRCHPLFKLLIPHMRYTVAINTLARSTLINEGGFIDTAMSVGGAQISLAEKGYREFDWRLLNLPDSLLKRKVKDPEKLPGYHYRDDALLLWEEIRNFIQDIVHIYYSSDGDVKKDGELQHWLADLNESGLPQHGLSGEVDHHVPKSLNTRKKLIEFLTCIVFCCSAQHAAENFGQFDYYSYNPNAPMVLRQPPPTKKGEVTQKMILDSLGTTKDACTQIAVTWTLAAFSDREVFLGNYPEEHFTEAAPREAMQKFQTNLRLLDEKLKERNKGLEVPYEYLLPSQVPNSIAV